MTKYLLSCLLMLGLAFVPLRASDEFDSKAAAAAVHVKKLKAHIAELQGELDQAEKIAKGTTKSAECVCDNCDCKNCDCAATTYNFNSVQGFHVAKNGSYKRIGPNSYQPAMANRPLRQASAPPHFGGGCSNGSCANGQCNTGGGFFGRRR